MAGLRRYRETVSVATKTRTDPGYLAIMAKAEELFVEGTTEDSVIYMM